MRKSIRIILLAIATLLTLGRVARAANTVSTPYMVTSAVGAQQLVCTISNVSKKIVHYSLTIFDETGNPHDGGSFDLSPNQTQDTGIGLLAGRCTWTVSGSKNDVRTGINVFDGNSYTSHADGR